MAKNPYRSILTLVELLAGAPPVERDDPLLREAFARLKASTDPAEAEQLDRLIWLAWDSGGSQTATEHLDRGLSAMAEGNMADAIAAFTQAIEADPGFAEAWNKRATAHFVAGDFTASIADIGATLIREPRHYGALGGLGQILLQSGETAAALQAFNAALAIHPHLAPIRELAAGLRNTADRPPPERPTLH
jgi:tetratricopeptide (TPR) repeat protein